MTVSTIQYPLVKGFVHNWLLAGPQTIPVDPSTGFHTPEAVQEIAAKVYAPDLGIDPLPVERGQLTDGKFNIGDYQGSWNYYRCQEDHLVIHPGSLPAMFNGRSPVYLRSWAYTQLVSPQVMDLTLRLSSPGPADVWLNHRHILNKNSLSEPSPGSETIPIRLAKGTNKLFVRFENLALGSSAHYFALCICDTQGVPLHGGEETSLLAQIPTLIIPRLVEMRNRMESLYTGVHLERDVFERDQEISLYLPEDETAEEIVTIRFKNNQNVVFLDGAVEGKPGMRRRLNFAYELTGGQYTVELLPRVHEYYELNMRIKKDIPVWTVGNAPYSTSPYGSYPERRQDGLVKAVEQRNSLFAEIAKMALGWWRRVETKVILEAVQRVNRSAAGVNLELAGLLSILYRFSEQPEFPQDLLQPIEDCVLNFEYNNQPNEEYQGSDQILSSACEIFAGQRYMDQSFARDGQVGRWHFERGMQQAFSSMQACGRTGFGGWGSSEELTRDLIALSLLVDLVDDEALLEMATVVMDKIFFTLATNMFQGILGSAQGEVWPTDLKGGILQPTCPVAKLMWGVGVFNHRIEGLVSLACMENYELPPLLAAIAADPASEIWSLEQHATAKVAVNKVSFRTPDTMLSAAQDYRPGEPGVQELVWQAVLGPSALVFTNHPRCSVEDERMLPGYWVGNAVLPRVAQWKNSLVALYDLPEDDWMGFTHAYFPTPAFDDYALRDGWAFARKGNGYLALTASTGFNLVTQGEHAYHELRAPGKQVTWICHMGRAETDGDFSTFQERILSLQIRYEGQRVEFDTPQGIRLSFGFQGAFLVGGKEFTFDQKYHVENPYTSTLLNSNLMDIVYGENVLRLDFTSPSDAGDENLEQGAGD